MRTTSSWLLTVLIGVGQLAAATPAEKVPSSIEVLQRRQAEIVAELAPQLSPGAQIHTNDWLDWANETARWSTYSAPTFNLVLIPDIEEDISTGLNFLTSRKIPFLAQGGGHGYSPTLGVIQNAVLINLERFNNITVKEDGSMVVGGSARFDDIYKAGYSNGRELTLGSCPCVGATGATLGGGHGRLQGKHGMSADALIKVRMAMWNGTVIEASASQNEDLFWGVRGAGQNFGVVIESTFQTYPQENNGMHYNADMVFTDDSIEGVIKAMNELIPDQDPALAMDLIFFADPSSLTATVYLNLVYAGTQEQGEKYADLFKTTAGGTNTTSSDHINRLSVNATMTSWDQLPYVSAGGAIAASCTKGLRQNTYTANLRQFDVNQTVQIYDSFRTFVKSNPKAVGSLILYEVFGQQGVVSGPDTAVGNREFGNVLVLVEMAYADDAVADVADEWAKGWRDTMIQPEISGYPREYVYQNYAHGDEPLEALYGYEPGRLQRLGKLKSQFDPFGFFNGWHTIPPQ